MATSLLGTRVTRVEDPALLRGGGSFVDNIPIEHPLHLLFLRSETARANITGIELKEALNVPGVVALYRAEDLGITPHHTFFPLNKDIKRPPLATGQVNFVGDPIVAIVATSREAAQDAMDLIEVSYEYLEPVVGVERSVAASAPNLNKHAPRNVAQGYRDPGFESALQGAEVVVKARFVNQRVAVAPMEGNAILVDPTPNDDGYVAVIWVSTQMPHGFANLVADVFTIDPQRLHVITPDVGGGFGGKAGLAAEHSVAIAAALKLQRPIKWVETRSENMIAMPHGRDQVQYVEMGLKHNGKITGLRCSMLGDAGAYGGFGGGLVLGSTRTMSQGTYDIERLAFSAAAVLTNTTPMGAFRGAGRPEAAEFLERIIDIAADELEMDPIELRRVNLIPKEAFPYTTQTGANYDVGDYEKALDYLLSTVDYDGLRKDQKARIEKGSTTLLGIGISTYVEITAAGAGEYAEVEVLEDGKARIKVGTSAHGQGHATSFAMLVSDSLGIPLENIEFVQSDTAKVPRGNGTGGSRSLQLGGSAVRTASVQVREIAARLLSGRLEVAPEDIIVSDNGLEVSGVPTTRKSWAELYRMAKDDGISLKSEFDFTSSGPTFPFGAHLSVVEIDIETGKITPISHYCVDDCGTIVNPLLVEGQQHGGATQGMSQVLYEHFQYDQDGNPLTTNFAAYAVPAATEVPPIYTFTTQTPTPNNPLGAKGIGESATVGATPAVHNAVIDALSHLGVRHIDMPCTPEKIWRAITEGSKAKIWSEPPDVFQHLTVRSSSGDSDAEEVDI